MLRTVVSMTFSACVAAMSTANLQRKSDCSRFRAMHSCNEKEHPKHCMFGLCSPVTQRYCSLLPRSSMGKAVVAVTKHILPALLNAAECSYHQMIHYKQLPRLDSRRESYHGRIRQFGFKTKPFGFYFISAFLVTEYSCLFENKH